MSKEMFVTGREIIDEVNDLIAHMNTRLNGLPEAECERKKGAQAYAIGALWHFWLQRHPELDPAVAKKAAQQLAANLEVDEVH